MVANLIVPLHNYDISNHHLRSLQDVTHYKGNPWQLVTE